MKRFYLSNITKNRSFVKVANVVLSAVMVTNIAGINGYSINKNNQAKAIPDHSEYVNVNRASGELKYFVSSATATDGGNLDFLTMVKITNEDNIAYCMEHWKDTPNGDRYSRFGIPVDKGMEHILYSSPGMGSAEEDYYVRQMALNHYQGDVDFIERTAISGARYRDKALELSREAVDVRAGTIQSTNRPAANTLSVSQPNAKFNLNGDYYETDWFTVGYTGDLINYNIALENSPSGVQIVDKNNQALSINATLSSSDNRFKLRVPKANVVKGYDDIRINLRANFNERELAEYHPVNNNQIQRVVVLNNTEKTIARTMTFRIDEPRGSLKVIKTGKNGVKLQGAEFKLQKGNLTVADNLVTNANGEVVVNDLALGTYSLIEKKSPVGYVMTNESANGINVVINANAQTVKNVSNNRIQGRIAVKKKDAELRNVGLEGAEFVIKDNQGAIVERLTTDSNGNALSQLLDYGTYTLEEVSSPTGYHLDAFNQVVNITENNKTYSYEVENRIFKGNLQIVKVNSQNEEIPIKDAGFDIIANEVKGVAKGTVVEHVVTDENGFAKTGDLRYGTYEIKEVAVPGGFLTPNKTYSLSILEDGKTYVKYIKNDPIQARMRLFKTDGKNKEALQGVKFKLINKDTGEDVVFKEYIKGEVVEKVELTTNENGEIMTPQELKAGNYQLVEVAPLEGYIGMEPIDIVIDENTQTEDIETIGSVHTESVTNDRIEGYMLLTKVDADTKQPIANVEFEVEGIEGFMKGQKFAIKTDARGNADISNLEYGKYKVTETKVDEKYVLNTEPQYFEIKTDGDVVELSFENKVKKGHIEIEKKDSESKRPLEDVEFTIYNTNDEVVGVYKTDKDGKFKSDELEYGKYKIKETKVLDNYIDNKFEFEFEILNDGEVIKKEVTNDPMKGDIFFQKIDSKTKEVLAGAKMKITGTDKINEHINIEFDTLKEGNEYRLPVGEYQIKEVSSPEGYIRTILPKKFEVKNGERLELPFENTKIPQNLSDILDKPVTGDTIMMSVILTVVSSVALVIINKDKFSKKKKWEKYKRD